MDNRCYRILLVSHQVTNVTSGPGVYARNLITRLLVNGHSVTVMTQAGETGDIPAGIRTITVANPPSHTGQARWFFLSHSFGEEIKRMAASGESFDLVHFVDARESSFCPRLWPSIGNVNDTYSLEVEPFKYYLTHYYDGIPRWLYYRINRVFERKAYQKLDRVVANSRYTEGMLLRSFPELRGKTTTIYKSIDPARFTDHQRHLSDKPTLLLVGSNLQRKGILPLLEAAASIKSQFHDLQLSVIGNDPLVKRYRLKAQQLGIGEACHFHGGISQADLPDYYHRAAVYCLPSLKEALGISMLEAMASGTPVIASRTGGIPEILWDGINGLLCEPGDPSSLAGCILRILTEPGLAEKCIQAGYETVQSFNVEKMVMEVMEEYKRLMPALDG